MRKLLCVFATLLTFSLPVAAEDEWEISWTPYIWAADISVDMDFGAGPVGVDLDFDEIIDKLDGVFMHYLEFRKGKWGVANEIIYLSLADSMDGPIGGVVSADAEIEQRIIDVVATYYTGHGGNTTLYAGLRHIDLDISVETESDLPPLDGLDLGGGDDWINPVIGFRQVFPLGEKWALGVKFDIATDLDDETSYFGTVGADYNISKLLDLKFGYRYAQVEYKNSDVDLNEAVSGAFVGLTFNW